MRWTARAVWPTKEAAARGIPLFVAACANAAQGQFTRSPTHSTLSGPVATGDYGQNLRAGDRTVSITFQARTGATKSQLTSRAADFEARSVIVRDTTQAAASPSAGEMVLTGIAEDPGGFAGDVASGLGSTVRDGAAYVEDTARGAFTTTTAGISGVFSSLGTTQILIGAVLAVAAYVYLKKAT